MWYNVLIQWHAPLCEINVILLEQILPGKNVYTIQRTLASSPFFGGGGCSVKASRIWGHKFHLITVNLDVDSDACVASHSICL